MSRQERTGFRDERISSMHRLWGAKLGFMNIDDIWVECDGTRCIAFMEYKLEFAQAVKYDDWQIKVLIDAAAGRPAFFIRYSNDGSRWLVVPLNPAANEIVNGKKEMRFSDFIRFQYELRGIQIGDKDVETFCAEMGWWNAA